LAEAGPELRLGALVQTLDGLGRVQAGDVLQARQPAAQLLCGIEQALQHGRKIRDVSDAVAVDEPHGLLRVEARHQHAGAAGVHVGHGRAERGDVEQGECEEVAIRRRQSDAGHGGQIGGDDVGVGQHRAARDHVDRRGGDDGERVGRRHLGRAGPAGGSVQRVAIE